MLKDIIPFVRYPYTAGIVGIIWLGTAVLVACDSDAQVILMLALSVSATIVVALMGFSSSRKA
jgi:hypothetical protein